MNEPPPKYSPNWDEQELPSCLRPINPKYVEWLEERLALCRKKLAECRKKNASHTAAVRKQFQTDQDYLPYHERED